MIYIVHAERTPEMITPGQSDVVRTLATKQYTESTFFYNFPERALPGGRPSPRSVYTETSFHHVFIEVFGCVPGGCVPKAFVGYKINLCDCEPIKRWSAKSSSEPNKLKIDHRHGSKNVITKQQKRPSNDLCPNVLRI